MTNVCVDIKHHKSKMTNSAMNPFAKAQPGDLTNLYSKCNQAIQACSDFVATVLAKDKQEEEPINISIGGDVVIEDVKVLIENYRSFLEKTNAISFAESKGFPVFEKAPELWVVGQISRFGSNWGDTGKVRKKGITMRHDEQSSYLKYGCLDKCETPLEWARSLELEPVPDFNSFDNVNVEDSSVYRLMYSLSHLSFLLTDYHNKIVAFARLYGFRQSANRTINKVLNDWIRKQRVVKDFEAITDKELETLWEKLIVEENGLQCPNNSGFKDVNMDTESRREENPQSALNAVPSVDLDNKPMDEDLASTFKSLARQKVLYLECKFKAVDQSKMNCTEEDIREMWTQRERKLAEHYCMKMNYQNRNNPAAMTLVADQIDVGRDVDHVWKKGVEAACKQMVPPIEHKMVTKDLMTPPQYNGEDALEESVYYDVISKDVNSGAVVAVKTRFNISSIKEYMDPQAVAVIATSGFSYLATIESEPDKTLSMRTSTNNLQDILDRRNNAKPSREEQSFLKLMGDNQRAKKRRRTEDSESTANLSP